MTSETAQTNEISVAPASTARVMTIGDMLASAGVSVVRQVTRTVLTQHDDVPFLVKFEAPIRESQVPEGTGRGGKPKMGRARVADVIEYVIVDGQIREGSRRILIANTVMEGELNRNYPDNGFIGKSFLMKSYFPTEEGSPTGKKAYKVYEILEVSVGNDGVKGEAIVSDASEPVNRAGKPKA